MLIGIYAPNFEVTKYVIDKDLEYKEENPR